MARGRQGAFENGCGYQRPGTAGPPLHFALGYNWTGPTVALWLAKLEEVNVFSEDNDSYTPLHFVSVNGPLEVVHVRSLHERAKKFNARGKNNSIPLFGPIFGSI